MKYDEVIEVYCPICDKVVGFDESTRDGMFLKDEPVMRMTRDCHGIPFRNVCINCYDYLMETKGYDGEYYTELDECIDDY